MNRKFKLIPAVSLALCLLAPCALADGISFSGSVAAADSRVLVASIGGAVASVEAQLGQQVKAGDVIATLETTKVYASKDGRVTGVFGQIGDNAETVAQSYGAVLYLEGDSDYTVAASTENAYNSTETMYVHVGETVYLKCRSDGAHTGVGTITAIEGTDYTVELSQGAFILDESVDVYRSAGYKAAERVGRGSVGRKNPVAVGGTGSIVSFAVQSGDRVQRGDLLFETLDGDFDGLYMSGSDIVADVDGTIAQLKLEAGGTIQKGGVAALIYPADRMRVEASISETDLASVRVGDPVSIELLWNQDTELRYEGVISMISAVADGASTDAADAAASDSASFAVYIDFTPDANTRYGMNAVVTTLDAEEGVIDEADAQALPENENE